MKQPPDWVVEAIPPGFDYLWHAPSDELWIAVWANDDIDADFELVAQAHAHILRAYRLSE